MNRILSSAGAVLASAVLLFTSLAASAAGQTAGPKLLKQDGAGKLYNLDGLRVVVLSGTFREMGRQYGTLLGNEIRGSYNAGVYEPFLKSKVFTPEELNTFADNLYKTLPMRQKNLLLGISSAANISRQEAVLAANLVSVEILARKKSSDAAVAACTSGAVWGKHTADGKVLTVRDFDFPNLFRTLLTDYGVLVVYNPTDGSNSLAGLTIAGGISFGDAINNKGLYIEQNNAADSAGLILYVNRTDAVSQVNNLLFDASDSKEFDNLIESLRVSYPHILMQADGSAVRYYELATWDLRKREAQGDTAIAAANQFLDPSWGVLTLPNPAAWYSPFRYETLLNLIKGSPGSFTDVKSLKAAVNIPFYNENGTIGKGVAVIKKSPKDDEVTVWQVITKPSELKMWVRYPTLTDWVSVDLKQFFQ